MKEFFSRFLPIVYTVTFSVEDGEYMECMPYVFLTMKSAKKYRDKQIKELEKEFKNVKWAIGGNQLWI